MIGNKTEGDLFEFKEIDKFIIDREDKVNGVYFIEIEIDGVKWFNKNQ